MLASNNKTRNTIADITKGSDLTEAEVWIDEKQPAFHYTDWTLGLSWSAKDYSKIIHDYYNKIWHYDRTRDIAMKHKVITEMEYEIGRYYDDQSSDLEPIDETYKFDKVVNAGRSRASKLITGEGDSTVSPIVKNTATFDYYGIGISQEPVTDGDWELGTEIIRINLRLEGFASGPGGLIKHNGIFSPGVSSIVVWESGQFDTPEPHEQQAMWSRAVFPPSKPLNHYQNQDFFTITHTVMTTSSA